MTSVYGDRQCRQSAPQGIACDLLATINGISRRDLDECAVRSQQLAAAAWSGGHFAKSVVPVKDINGLTVLAEDEHMRPEVTADGLGKLGSAFAGLAELGGFDDVAKQRNPAPPWFWWAARRPVGPAG